MKRTLGHRVVKYGDETKPHRDLQKDHGGVGQRRFRSTFDTNLPGERAYRLACAVDLNQGSQLQSASL
jgi:hypothetical protein